MFAGKKSAQIREILISESAWEEMTCLFAPSFLKLFWRSGAHHTLPISSITESLMDDGTTVTNDIVSPASVYFLIFFTT